MKIKILRFFMFKTTCIHSLTSVNTLCWLGYPNRSALDKSSETYDFDRRFSSCRRCIKGQFWSDHFFWEHVFGKFSWALCSTTNSRLKVHSSLRRTSQVSWVYCLNNIFTSKKQEQFSRHKCKTLMSQHIIYFIVGMWSHLQASRKCRHFCWA